MAGFLWWAAPTRDESVGRFRRRDGNCSRGPSSGWPGNPGPQHAIVAEAHDGRFECRLLASQGALLVTRALRGLASGGRSSSSFLKWQAFSGAVAQYLLIEDERERDHDVAIAQGGLGHEDRAAQGIGGVGAHTHHTAFAILPSVARLEWPVVSRPRRPRP